MLQMISYYFDNFTKESFCLLLLSTVAPLCKLLSNEDTPKYNIVQTSVIYRPHAGRGIFILFTREMLFFRYPLFMADL
jgi:hypothetical protein